LLQIGVDLELYFFIWRLGLKELYSFIDNVLNVLHSVNRPEVLLIH
jgi:hypothetical protein